MKPVKLYFKKDELVLYPACMEGLDKYKNGFISLLLEIVIN